MPYTDETRYSPEEKQMGTLAIVIIIAAVCAVFVAVFALAFALINGIV